uniref:NADH:ubiquinone reductase (non-electrogenic) n=1 Tax=Haptolina brevifila TaxID=156173 RepID=A0A7S2DLC2_9EUKA
MIASMLPVVLQVIGYHIPAVADTHRVPFRPLMSATAAVEPQGRVVPTQIPFDDGCTYQDRTPKTLKEKIVVLGSGWAAVKFVQNIDTTKYDVSIISPRNFFLFTPFLPSVTVGTVEGRSIVEPIRKLVQYDARPITRKIKDRFAGVEEETFEEARFVEAMCTKIDPSMNRVYCQDVSSVAGTCDTFSLDYDKLVIAIGATSNTFNTPGVKENALFLKEIQDATVIRSRILDAFETASQKETKEEKQQLLEFVVVGAGPTGVEFAAELDDYIREDLFNLYPEEVAAARVVLISSSDDLLSSYDKKISDFTMKVLEESRVELRTGVRVTEVTKDSVVCKDKKTGETFAESSSLTLWSTGVKPVPLLEDVIAQIPEQTKRSGLFVDSTLKAYGMENVYALGDCATVYSGNAMQNELAQLFTKADADGSGTLDKAELLSLFGKIADKYPQAEVFENRIKEDDVFEQFDDDGSGELDMDEFRDLLAEVDSMLRSLPPTAQVAGQQGGYLASLLNGETTAGFKYFHKGSMAYVGQEKAAAQVSMLKSILPEPVQALAGPLGEDIVLTGGLAEIVWKALYLDMQISNRNKAQVAFDWIKVAMFGRDTSRY